MITKYRISETNLVSLIKKILKEDEIALDVVGDDPPPEVIDNVECIQKALKAAGLGSMLGTTGPNKDGVDGIYGMKTKAAVKEFQKRNGINQTGFVGDQTAPKLGCKSMKKKTTTPTPTKPVTEPPKKEDVISCPSIKNSPYFRDLETTISYWSKKFPFFNREKIIEFVDRMINLDAQTYMKDKIMTQSVACEVASIGRRPQYNDKYVFIVDSPNKRIFLFDKDKPDGSTTRKLIAQDIIMDGKDKQRNDAYSTSKAFTTYGEVYYDLLKKNKKPPSEDEVWNVFTKEKTRYMPAGIYQGLGIESDSHYAGSENNLLTIKNWLGKEVGQALHGYYMGDERVPFMKKAMDIVKNPNDPKQIESFNNEMKNKGLKMDWSYGCINLPPRFLKYLREYGPNSFIFNIAEDTKNYLVQNTQNFFDKQKESEECLSPEALGGQATA